MFKRGSASIIIFVAFVIIASPSAPGAAVRGPARSVDQETQYVCPMHPDVVSRLPGSCPKCGMTLRAQAQEDTSHSAENAAPIASKQTASTLKIPDTPVYDQNGRRLRFYTDVVKGKTVAINFIFTTCTTICPPLTATFRKVQQELGARSGHRGGLGQQDPLRVLLRLAQGP